MYPSFLRLPSGRIALLLIGLHALPAFAGSNQFCGGPAKGGDPSDLENVVGDQTLEYAAQQPASMLTCARGYLVEKCGDHATANRVFDKCIAAGFVGAMIWKALLLEEGDGVERDPVAATRLMQRAANSDDPAYGPIGMLHYATELHQGKGVARDEAEARRWFERAAAAGNEEARTFLRTGYHTGARGFDTLGAGQPTAEALAPGVTGDNASLSPPPPWTPNTPTASAGAPKQPSGVASHARAALARLMPLRPLSAEAPIPSPPAPATAAPAPVAEARPESLEQPPAGLHLLPVT